MSRVSFIAAYPQLTAGRRAYTTGLWRLLEPLVGAELRSNGAKEKERLKAVVEKG